MAARDELKSIQYLPPTSDEPNRHRFVATTDWGEVTFAYDTRTPNADPVQITIRPVNETTLSPETLRRVRLAGLRSQTAKKSTHPLVKWMAAIDPNAEEPWLADPRPGRRGREDHDYAIWANRYVDALETTSHPIKKLREEHHLSESAIRAILNRARDRRLLTKSPQGRAGGVLTKKAMNLLNELGDN
ncbi:MAG: hypothetical protein HN348_34630 [Proteobacteria bacterium]|jgi:hypothetical protein|nr:hypothetical protein [Pseudomonadota bacterium]